MILRPPRSTRTAPLFPYTTLFRSELAEQTIADRGSARRDVGRFGRIGCQVDKLGVGAAEPGEQLPIALADGDGRRAIVLTRGFRSLLGGALLTTCPIEIRTLGARLPAEHRRQVDPVKPRGHPSPAHTHDRRHPN